MKRREGGKERRKEDHRKTSGLKMYEVRSHKLKKKKNDVCAVSYMGKLAISMHVNKFNTRREVPINWAVCCQHRVCWPAAPLFTHTPVL